LLGGGKIEAFAREPDGALLFPPDVTVTTHREFITALVARHRLPAVVAANCRQSAIDRRPRDPKKSPNDLAVPRNRKSGRADRLWARHPGSFSSGRRLKAREQTGRAQRRS
jgi:hypothetical protein